MKKALKTALIILIVLLIIDAGTGEVLKAAAK